MSLLVTDPVSGQSLSDAVDWLRALLFGSIGTTVAILAVAGVGLLMLSGRVPVRRGAMVVIGCFILFSASIIAQGLMMGPVGGEFAVAPQTLPDYVPAEPKPEPYDPYAGAAVHAQQPRDLFR